MGTSLAVPVVDTLPCKAGDEGLIPGCGNKIPCALKPKKQNTNRSNIVTNSIKTLKTVHIKKNKKNFEKEKKGASIFVSIYLVILLLHIF